MRLIQDDDPERYFGRVVLDRDALRDDQWAQILPLIPGGRAGKHWPRTDNQRFINVLLWMARSGARWKDLPPDFGAFQTVKRRYYRWLERGLIDRLFDELGQDADLEWLMLDSTVIRAHQHAAGVPKKEGPESPRFGPFKGRVLDQALCRHRRLRQPCRLLAGPGQENDMAKAFDLLDGIKPGAVLADRAYDADRLMDAILDADTEPVIPPRRHRKHQHAYDKALYKERNVIERFFNKLKQCRRVATRYDKLLNNFTGFVKIAAIAIWLR